jgi:HK97 family phage prohead protease
MARQNDSVRSIGRLLAPVEFKFSPLDSPEAGTFEGYGSVFNKQDWHGDIVMPGAFTDSLGKHKSGGTMPGMYAEHSFANLGGDPLPIGVWLSLEEDENGLKGIGKISALDSDHGKRVYGLMRDGALKGLSIAYSVADGGSTAGKKPGEPKRWLKALDLYSIDIVREPSNSDAQISALKAVMAQADHAGALAAVRAALALHASTMSGGDSPNADERAQMYDHLCNAHVALTGEKPKTADKPETIRDFEQLLRDVGYSNRLARDIAEHGWKAAHSPRDGAAAESEAATKDAINIIADALRNLSLNPKHEELDNAAA